jgi:hypothetical protein
MAYRTITTRHLSIMPYVDIPRGWGHFRRTVHASGRPTRGIVLDDRTGAWMVTGFRLRSGCRVDGHRHLSLEQTAAAAGHGFLDPVKQLFSLVGR